MRLRPALLLTVFLTAGTFLIAGCGSNDPASAPPAGGGQVPAAGGGGGANANQVDCPTSAMVGQHLGFTPKGDVDVTRGSSETVVCSYNGTFSDGKSATALLRLGTDTSPSYFADFKKQEADQGYKTIDVTGLGDEAFRFETQSFGVINNLVARKGNYQIYVGAQATVEQETELVKALFSQRG